MSVTQRRLSPGTTHGAEYQAGHPRRPDTETRQEQTAATENLTFGRLLLVITYINRNSSDNIIIPSSGCTKAISLMAATETKMAAA